MSEVVEIEDVEAAPAVAYQTGDEVPEGAEAAEGGAMFVHLSVHSEYSLRDGLAKVGNLAQRVAELGMPAVALTDHANLFGLVKFYSACRDAGVKALIGADLHYADGDADGTSAEGMADDGLHRCIVLVASEVGYRNLLRLVSSAYTEAATANGAGDAANGHGRVTREAIFASAEGLLVLLGRHSDVGAALPNPDAAAKRLAPWRTAFGDRLYLELSRTGRLGEGRFVVDCATFAAAQGVPVVASNDVRFLRRDDFEAHETRVCIQEGRVLNDPRRERRYSEQQYLRSAAEMRDLFADLPEAIDNSVEVARRCSCAMRLGTYYLPSYPVPEGFSLESLLEHRAREGLAQHLAQLPEKTDALAAQYRERLDYELGVITEMDFAGYFLIVQEFVNWGREDGVPVGCRGSGNASLVAFCLGITELDPLRYDLLFERLLNPERVSMPDFDIDFCMEGRERVISHVAQRYGHDAVSQIVTFGTMAARLVVRDVARVQGKPFGLADRLSKMIPFELGMTLAKAMEQQPELASFVEGNEDAAEIMDMAYRLEGVVRNTGKHAGGVVIAPTRLTDFVPLYADQPGGTVVSQFDLHDVEEAGLVKFDFLGLKTLTIIDWALSAVNAERKAQGEPAIDVKTLPLDDADTYAFLREAETTAVFQLESEGMKDLIRRLKPDSIDDIIALVALYRPGPLQSGAVDDYVNRKHGKAPLVYPHPSLESALKNTYGVMLYQEQVMNMGRLLAGFSLGQADLLRRAMAKKKPEEMAEMRTMFLAGTDAHDVDRRVANDIFDQVEKFAGYAFNKAHAAAYALLSFQTAWLKAHCPAQFMAAVLSADMQTIDKVVELIDEVQRMDLHVHPPDVNASGFRFGARDNGILYGLGAVRGLGEAPVAAIVEERERGGPFRDLGDFCRRVEGRRANKRVVEALVRSGAMDAFRSPDEDLDAIRGRLLGELPDALLGAEQVARDAQLGVEDMFGGAAEPAAVSAPRTHTPLTTQERLEGEKETLGLYLTGHPMEEHRPEIRRFCKQEIGKLAARQGIQTVAGVVVSNRTRRGRRGAMAFATLDDRSGRIEVSLYGEVFQHNRGKLEKDAVLVVEGEVQADDYAGNDALKLRAERVMTLSEARKRHARCVAVRLDSPSNGFVADLKRVLGQHRDNSGCMIAVDYSTAKARARVALGRDWRVDASDALLEQLRERFGAEAVTVDYAA